MIFKPRILPRGNLTDWLLGMSLGGCLLAAVLAVGWIFVSVWHGVFLSYFVWGCLTALLFLSLNYLMVSSVRVDEDGIFFRRKCGNPKEIRWADLHAVEVSTQSNAFWNGYILPQLKPPFLPKEMSWTFSFMGHVRMVYGDGKDFYYAPADTEAFLREIHRYWSPADVQASASSE